MATDLELEKDLIEDEIIEMHKNWRRVIKLLDYMPFDHKVTLDQLRKQGIIAPVSGPRTFDPITPEQYRCIYKLGTEK